MIEAARTSDFYQTTWRYNPEDSHLHTRRHENLKLYRQIICFRNGYSEKSAVYDKCKGIRIRKWKQQSRLIKQG
jgi:hypothetical protein